MLKGTSHGRSMVGGEWLVPRGRRTRTKYMLKGTSHGRSMVGGEWLVPLGRNGEERNMLKVQAKTTIGGYSLYL